MYKRQVVRWRRARRWAGRCSAGSPTGTGSGRWLLAACWFDAFAVAALVVAALARMPRAVHGMRASMALQGVIFGACQSGITALTERLHQPAQAGLVYAAMGVMRAVAGLSLALVPARILSLIHV